jgi:hypothetical protein
MTYSFTGAVSIAFSRLEMKTRLSGTVSASVLTWDAFCGTWPYSGNVFELMKLYIELCCSCETNSVCNILFGTPMDVIRMSLVNCCNEWSVVLNHYDLGLYVGSCLKSFKISRLPGLWEVKYRNLITLMIVFCTYVLIIWSVLLQRQHRWRALSRRAAPPASNS